MYERIWISWRSWSCPKKEANLLDFRVNPKRFDDYRSQSNTSLWNSFIPFMFCTRYSYCEWHEWSNHLQVKTEQTETTDGVHVDAASERARVLIRLNETRCQGLRYKVELDELAYAGQHLMVLLGAAVQTQHDRRNVAEYSRAHQS